MVTHTPSSGMTRVLLRRSTETDMEENCVEDKDEAGIRVMCYEQWGTKDCQKTPENRKRQERIISYSLQREHSPEDALISDY